MQVGKQKNKNYGDVINGDQIINNYMDMRAVEDVVNKAVIKLTQGMEGVQKNDERLIFGVKNELFQQIFEIKRGENDIREAVKKRFEHIAADQSAWVLQIGQKLDRLKEQYGKIDEALSEFRTQTAKRANEQSDRFKEWQEKQIEGRRRKLFEVTHEENIQEELVLFYARKLLELVPDDTLARFYLLVSESNAQAVNAYLDEMDVVLQGNETVCAVLDYLIEPLEPRMEPSLRKLTERAFQEEVFRRGEYLRYISAIESGKSFDMLRQWDLFVAYSSKDRLEVDNLVKELEEQEISCFVAYRDLPHGRGAGGEKYWNDLKCAMRNSRGIVFVSTPNSRSRSCDAIEREDKSVDEGAGELPYYEKHFSREEKLRIEYRPGSDKNTVTPRSVEQMLKRFFGDVNYCQTPEEVADIAARHFFPQMYDAEETFETENIEAEAAAARLAEEQRKEEGARRAEEQRKEEEARKAEEARRAEELKQKPWLAPDYPTLENYDTTQYEIEGTTLKKYLKRYFVDEVKIPLGVTSIGAQVFHNFSGLKSITIPDGVTSIGYYAFSGCRCLTSITIPNSVTAIGECAFRDCRLTSITIPKSVTSIGEGVFIDCNTLEKLEVEEGNPKYRSEGNCLIEISTNMLVAGCKNSTIPNGVTSIGYGAFCGYNGLTSITFPNSVTAIGDWAFCGCSGLNSITIPNSVTSIGRGAFSRCNKLEIFCEEAQKPSGWNVSWNPDQRPVKWDCKYSVDGQEPWLAPDYPTLENYDTTQYEIEGTTLKKYLKKGFAGEVKIPLGVTSIGEDAFLNCSGLTSITIPDSVTSIGDWAFFNCSGLTSITIPDSVTSIGDWAFFGCSGLNSITIPKSVTSIGKGVFVGCNKLEKLKVEEGNPKYRSEGNCLIEISTNTLVAGCKNSTIPYGIKSIGGSAFRDCSGLTSIKIPKSVTVIGDEAFCDCSGLTSITIPNGVTSIGVWAFAGCYTLEKLEVEEGNPKYRGEGNCIIEISTNTLVAGCKSSTIPDSVTSIGEYAFRHCNELTSVTIPNSVTSIGEYAFFGCSRLTSVTIPNSVTSIGGRAFFACSELTSVTIANNVISIGECAFYGCSGLTSITIPNSVTLIGNGAFASCDKLEKLEVEEGNPQYRSEKNCIIEIPTSTLVAGCKSSIIPNSVTLIRERAFYGCSGLTSITIPNSVTSIGEEAFFECSGLTSIAIPNSVTSIGCGAFYCCSKLKIYCEAAQKPSGWDISWHDALLVVWGYKKGK